MQSGSATLQARCAVCGLRAEMQACRSTHPRTPADRLAVQAEYHDVLFEVLLYAFGDK